MTFRKAALLAAVADAVSFIYSTLILFSPLWRHISFDTAMKMLAPLVPRLAFVLFFISLYGEATGRATSNRRSAAAITAAVLVLVQAGYVIWLMRQTVVLSRNSEAIIRVSVPWALSMQFCAFIIGTLWVAFLVAFAGFAFRRTIPSIAFLLAILTLINGALSRYFQLRSMRPAEGSLSFHAAPVPLRHTIVGSVVSLFSWVSLLVFLVVVWHRWKPDMAIDQNVVAQ